MSTREKLLSEIEAYMAEHNIAATTFGVLAMNDRTLVRTLRAGREPSVKTLDRVRAFMSPKLKKKKPKARRRNHAAQAAA